VCASSTGFSVAPNVQAKISLVISNFLRSTELESLIAGLVAAAEVLASHASTRTESLEVGADFFSADSEALALVEGGGDAPR